MPKRKKGESVKENIELDGERKNIVWETEQVQVESKTHLEDDKGHGKEVILRFFEYTANPEAFKDKIPSAQVLFNAHLKEMEIQLWKDGLIADPNIEPRLLFSKDKTHYKFVIGCRLGRGQILTERPVTLKELTK